MPLVVVRPNKMRLIPGRFYAGRAAPRPPSGAAALVRLRIGCCSARATRRLRNVVHNVPDANRANHFELLPPGVTGEPPHADLILMNVESEAQGVRANGWIDRDRFAWCCIPS